MDECIDYTEETKKYLRNYGKMKVAIQNLGEEIKLRSTILQSESVPISRYGGQMGGNAGGMTGVEAAVYQHDKAEQRLEQLKQEKARYELIVRKVDRALDGLSATGVALVKGHFMKQYTWQELGQQYGYTERWARRRGNRALQAVSFMLFGVNEPPCQLKMRL